MITRGEIAARKLVCPVYLQDFARPGAVLTEARGLFDTGATRTLIVRRTAQAAGLTLEGSIDVRGVNSAARLPATAIQVGFVPEGGTAPYVLEAPLRAAVNRPQSDPNAAESYDVLIGMDLIGRSVLTVDGPASRFVFEIG